MSHEQEREQYEERFLLMGIKPWEMDLLTVDQFERMKRLADELEQRQGV